MDMSQFGLGTAFPPAALLSILGDQIAVQLKKEVKKYVMIYDGITNKVEFKINNDENRLPFEDSAFADAIRTVLEPELQEGFTLQYAFLYYEEEGLKCSMDLHMINEQGQKINVNKVF